MKLELPVSRDAGTSKTLDPPFESADGDRRPEETRGYPKPRPCRRGRIRRGEPPEGIVVTLLLYSARASELSVNR